MATRTRLSLSTLSALLVAAPAIAAFPQLAPDQLSQLRAQEGPRAQASVTSLMARRSDLGLDGDASLRPDRVHTDAFGQTHAHLQQLYRGVRVWGGEAITHMDKNGEVLAPTLALKAGINLDTTPALRADEALAFAHQDLAPRGSYTTKPTIELVVFPVTAQVHARPGHDATAFERQVVRYALAYHIHTSLLNGAAETRQTDYMVDAQTGAILKKWSSLETASAVGTGNSQYSGTVQINTNSISGGYELRDMTRGTGGTFGNNVVTDMANGTSGNGTIFTNSTNTWGDGANYSGSNSTSPNGQTAAVDAAFGIQCTWDMFKNVFGRNGIDGAGKASYLRVHYSSAYDNAFWDDACFCMTFGDGSQFTVLTAVDVAGHEMSHGVIANSVPGGLTYSGESGGLNESNSDIFGEMVEAYAHAGGEASQSTTIPATGTDFQIGEQLSATPLRYMYKPSLDGSSPDAWSSSIGSLDVHFSSGPGNREFYFLSQGASSDSTTNYYSSYTPAGFAGVGNDHAARIHYRAMTTYYTSNETYAQARAAHLSAASDLYGAASPEYAAVENSFAAINVGSPASTTPNTVTASITTPAGNVTIGTGTAQSFVGTGTDSSSTATLSYSWTFGDGGTATGASASHTYTNTGTSAVSYTATLKVTDNTGVSSTATRTITVNPAVANTVTATITTPSANVTIASGTNQPFAGTGTDSSSTATLAYSWTFGDGGTATGASASHTYTNTGTSAVSYTATLKVTDSTGVSKTATRTITVNPASVPTNTVKASITTPSGNVTVASGASQAFAGSATDSSSSATLSYGWNFGDGSTATGASTSHVFTNTGSAAITRTVTFTATDNTGVSASATRTVTVNPATGGGGTKELILNGGFESGTASWTSTSGVIGANGPSEPAHSGSNDAWLDGYGSSHTDYVYQSVAIPSTATSATLSFYLHIDTAEDPAGAAYDKFTILVQNASGTTLATLGTFSNLNAGSGYTLHTYDLSAYKGQTIRLKFNGVEDASLQTSFVLDDVSVKVQ